MSAAGPADPGNVKEDTAMAQPAISNTAQYQAPGAAFVSLQAFVSARFHAHPILQKYYGSAENYLAAYVRQYGAGEWLEALRGVQLDVEASIEVVSYYVEHANRGAEDIPRILGSLERQYDIAVPVEEGILTPEYWVPLVERLTH